MLGGANQRAIASVACLIRRRLSGSACPRWGFRPVTAKGVPVACCNPFLGPGMVVTNGHSRKPGYASAQRIKNGAQIKTPTRLWGFLLNRVIWAETQIVA